MRRAEVLRGGRVMRRVETNDAGYFELTLPDRSAYSFVGYDEDGKRVGRSRNRPVAATPSSD